MVGLLELEFYVKWKKWLAHRTGRRIGQIARLHRWTRQADFEKKSYENFETGKSHKHEDLHL